MWRTCGAIPSTPFASSARRCSTPKRCCSSTTQTPRRAKLDRSARSARGCRPRARARRWRAAPAPRAGVAPGVAPVSSANGIASWASSRSSVARAARRGSRSAPSAPPGSPPRAPAASRRAATTVLPEPTSPISSRCIGSPESRSRVDLVERRALVGGRRERERLDPALDHLAGRAEPRRRPGGAVGPLARGQDRLVEEQLLEREPRRGRPRHRPRPRGNGRP